MDQSIIQPKKGKPGRPKLNKDVKIIKKEGIVTTPILDNGIMDLAYNNPMVFKKIFSLFDTMKIKDIRIEFRSDKICIKTYDHLEKNTIIVTINSSQMVRYYRKYDFDINLDPGNIQNVLKKLDKNYTSVTFLSYEESYTNEIILVFARDDIKMHEKHVIKLIDSNCIDSKISSLTFDMNYINYPLNFTLNSKIFKKIINDIQIFSDFFTIEKSNDMRLTMKYNTPDNTTKSKNIFGNDEIIKLKSELEQNQIFSVTTKIEYVKSLSSALISDNITIYLDFNKNIIFSVDVDDKAFNVLIYTSIIRCEI